MPRRGTETLAKAPLNGACLKDADLPCRCLKTIVAICERNLQNCSEVLPQPIFILTKNWPKHTFTFFHARYSLQKVVPAKLYCQVTKLLFLKVDCLDENLEITFKIFRFAQVFS